MPPEHAAASRHAVAVARRRDGDVVLFMFRSSPCVDGTRPGDLCNPDLSSLAGRDVAGYNYVVIMIRFEWDDRKSSANRRKHGVSFGEAQTVFFDEDALEFPDPDHGDRFLMLGMSLRLRVLVVCHCFRESATVIRIISARKATRAERRAYGRRRS